MQPLNAPERKKAFFNFLLFFVITVAVILVTVYFSMQVPLKDNDKLIKETALANNEKLFMQEFEGKMQETTNLVESITKVENVFKIGKDLDNHFKDMNNMISETVWSKDICNKIIDNLISLRSAKDQLRNVNNSVIELEKKDNKIKELDAESTKWRDLYIQAVGKK